MLTATDNKLIEDITNILKTELPNFWHEVYKYKFMGYEMIAVKIACSNYLINNVPNQRCQAVSLSLDINSLELQPQVFGGCGGQRIYRNINPNDPSEKHLAMQGIKIPFRKPPANTDSVYKAIRKFCINYKSTLIINIDQLKYKDLIDYNKLLGL